MAITLTKATAAPELISGRQHVWPLQVVAVSDTTDLPSEIFVYHASMDDDQLNDMDIFECVASVEQLDELGTTPVEADPGNGVEAVPYYRSDTLLFGCRSATELEELWEKIKEDVVDLHLNFMYYQDLQTEETFTTP